MRRKVAPLIGLVAVLSIALPVAGCGEEEGEDALESVEGEPLEVGELIYNVAITRFLNPNTTEDAQYLEGLPEEPPGQSYLGVFLRIDNESDEEVSSAQNYAVTDASDRVYEPVETDSQYALEIGALIPSDGEIPSPDTTAAAGPTQGALLLFLVEDDVSEERPLELEVNGVLGEGTVELDI